MRIVRAAAGLALALCLSANVTAALARTQTHFEQRVAVFRTYAPMNGGVAFVGDSLTERGAWEASFPGATVRNYGVDGDTTIRLQRRLDQVIAARPAKIFLMIGTNDLGAHGSPPQEVSVRYARVLQRLHAGLPNAHLFVQSVLPREAEYAARVEVLNRDLQALAQANGAVYVDLFPAFAAADQSLRPELTIDGLHLNAAGYELWRRLIETQVSS